MSLATGNEPLKLADGRLVYPSGKITEPDAPKMVEIPTNQEAVKLVVAARKKVADLPDVPRSMNIISVVLTYSLFGLSDEEIALAINASEQKIGQIKMMPAYDTMHQAIVKQILEADRSDIQSLIQQSARKSMQVMQNALENSRSETNKIIVAKDILDRSGFRPADVVEHRHSMQGGFSITVVKKDDTAAGRLPQIDLEGAVFE